VAAQPFLTVSSAIILNFDTAHFQEVGKLIAVIGDEVREPFDLWVLEP
jgi:UDP-N-acetylenolpyruvoylglucosamine reductase